MINRKHNKIIQSKKSWVEYSNKKNLFEKYNFKPYPRNVLKYSNQDDKKVIHDSAINVSINEIFRKYGRTKKVGIETTEKLHGFIYDFIFIHDSPTIKRIRKRGDVLYYHGSCSKNFDKVFKNIIKVVYIAEFGTGNGRFDDSLILTGNVCIDFEKMELINNNKDEKELKETLYVFILIDIINDHNIQIKHMKENKLITFAYSSTILCTSAFRLKKAFENNKMRFNQSDTGKHYLCKIEEVLSTVEAFELCLISENSEEIFEKFLIKKGEFESKIEEWNNEWCFMVKQPDEFIKYKLQQMKNNEFKHIFGKTIKKENDSFFVLMENKKLTIEEIIQMFKETTNQITKILT
jgi:hypothetical protein